MAIAEAIDIAPEHLRFILDALRRYLPNTTVWVYGSRMKWTSRPQSDMDMVVFSSSKQRVEVSTLREIFAESILPFRVDLFVWDEVPEQFRKNITAEHVVLQERIEPVGKNGLDMAGEWKRKTLSDVIELISGGTPNTSIADYWNGNIPWLSVGDFNSGYRWVHKAKKSITDLGVLESATTVLNQGDIVISARGTVGVLVQLAKPMAFNQSCYGIRGKPGIAETNYIYYALRHTVSEMKQVAHGGVFDTITRDTFKIISIDLPPLSEQKAIAHILGSLDDKIENNRKMNETLEGMARAIFKSWFVDFDPVRAKMEGRKPYGMDATTAALFPDSFVDSPMGKIPKGWSAGVLSGIIEIIGGGTPKTSVPQYWDGVIPWFSVMDAPQGSDTWVIDTKKKIAEAGLNNLSTRLLSKGTTIISARGTVGKCALAGKDMAMNQSCYAIHGIEGYGDFFVYFTVQNEVSNLQQHTHGSVFDTITRNTFDSIAIVMPSKETIAAFEVQSERLMHRILANLYESQILASIRDTLMPKLLTGQIRIKDAENMVET